MYRVFLFFIFFFSNHFLGYSQLYLGNIFRLENAGYGLKTGLNMSRINNIHYNSKSTYGIQAGAFLSIPIDYHRIDREFIQVEVLYSQIGERNASTEKYNLNYIEIPFYYKRFITQNNDLNLFGLIGPQIGFQIGENFSDLKSKNYLNDVYKTFDYGISLGGGVAYNKKVDLALMCYYGFRDIIADDLLHKMNNNGYINLSLNYKISEIW